MIFESDYRLTTAASCAVAHFETSASRVFNILNDPSSWGQSIVPRVASATAHSKIVWTFDGLGRATGTFSSWNTGLCQLEISLDGFKTESARAELERYWQEVVSTAKQRVGKSDYVVASSPAKINVYFAVGAFQKDGFHEVASCYQGLSLRDKVAVELAGSFSISFAGPLASQCETLVPKSPENLVYKAGLELKRLGAQADPELVSFTIHKAIPIAGGMAGGSADGAAALIALNRLFNAGLEEQLNLAATKLGSDVPFSLAGGTSIGTGRGQKLQRVENHAVLHWVLTPSTAGLSTPEVYRKLDILRTEAGVDVSKIQTPEVPEDLVAALIAGDAAEVSKLMHNDLEVAAVSLRPELTQILEAGRKAGSLKSMVSGSGPTVLHLAKDRIHAEQIVSRLAVAGYPSLASFSSQSGTRLES